MISGHVIIRKAVANDFPLLQCVLSALPICSEFIILCDPDEPETVDLCNVIAGMEHPSKVRVVVEPWWFPERGMQMLADATDRCIEMCRGDWHLQLQADEVLHEDEIGLLQEAARGGECDWVQVGFHHFWRDFNTVIIPETRFQVAAWRMARRSAYPLIRSWADAFSLGVPASDPLQFSGLDLRERVKLCHYGFVNAPLSRAVHESEMCQCILNTTDPRTQGSQEEFFTINDDSTESFTGRHPALMTNWIRERFQ